MTKTKNDLLHEKRAISALNKGVILGCDIEEGTLYLRKSKSETEIYSIVLKRNKSERLEPLIEGDYKSLIGKLSGSLNNKCYIVDYPVVF
ncbi:hypothetical protein [Bacillus sonorensis]|uniref:hypothetical protein n=1 Tax=Bacillus sonorensis TaxID=119858 RepID=UPI002DBFE971|nr:hypothetical protein [Bacillus sonorensis]MEC0341947.1 hypothetical protein [Bacillus sonorensis]MEC0457368.1 hypothetical protein [Bacillus sonorensis]MEC0530666.1 hypothetical protein [Bacillus sonorensis]